MFGLGDKPFERLPQIFVQRQATVKILLRFNLCAVEGG